MIYFNQQTLRDKIYGCWIGKNIGGTIGGPYEGQKELLDVQGFSTAPGEALPNDDLDLQLVWLRAATEQGPLAVNANVLGEYWTYLIGPHWNEYGVCKANMRAGLLPPLSGSAYNEEWENSNGAWIRTEIWACANPGRPDNALRYAFEDACVDHGLGEGTYAAVFIAALESSAFVISDIRRLIRIGLSQIPSDCRVARSVNMVLDAYDSHMDWKELRARIVEDSADLGWFQAPANVAFVILGLLYGERDFKSSMIHAVNCGDDTDCTGATVGAILGILYGASGLPSDWRAYIGDKITTFAIVRGWGEFPKTCTELTEKTVALIPEFTRYRDTGKHIQNGETVKLWDGPDDFSEVTEESLSDNTLSRKLLARSKYSFTVSGVFASVLVEYPHAPTVSPMGELDCRVSVIIKSVYAKQDHYTFHWHLPEGWSVDGPRSVFAAPLWYQNEGHATANIKIRAGESVEAINRLILEVCCPDHAMPVLVPVTVIG